MFTGIITDTTDVRLSKLTEEGLAITFERPKTWLDMRLGESVATNGVCLTVSKLGENEYEAFLMPETLHKTAFGSHVPSVVNLERSLSVADRIGGHFVQGHVDCVGTVSKIDNSDGWQLSIDFPSSNRKLVIPQGSVTVDGLSLTVAALKGNTLMVALIPHTLENTTIRDLKVGDPVNLEFDMIGKYVVNLMEQSHANSAAS